MKHGYGVYTTELAQYEGLYIITLFFHFPKSTFPIRCIIFRQNDERLSTLASIKKIVPKTEEKWIIIFLSHLRPISEFQCRIMIIIVFFPSQVHGRMETWKDYSRSLIKMALFV